MPLLRQSTKAIDPDKMPRMCEVCGKVQKQEQCFSVLVSWVYTGHPLVAGFNCDAIGGQHWGCTPEHAMEAAKVCMEEHLHPSLMSKHEDANASMEVKQ